MKHFIIFIKKIRQNLKIIDFQKKKGELENWVRVVFQILKCNSKLNLEKIDNFIQL